MAYDDNKGIEKELALEDRSRVTRRDSTRPMSMGGGEIVITFLIAIGAIALILGAIYGVYHWLF